MTILTEIEIKKRISKIKKLHGFGATQVKIARELGLTKVGLYLFQKKYCPQFLNEPKNN